MNSVTFIDTTVLCELLKIPGKSSATRSAMVQDDLIQRWQSNEEFVIPITTLIETGNHIAQCRGDRYDLAGKLVRFVEAATAGRAPWRVLETQLGKPFLESWCAGASTGETLANLAARGVGAGDVALLVERDMFLEGSAYTTAAVWTFDQDLEEASQRS